MSEEERDEPLPKANEMDGYEWDIAIAERQRRRNRLQRAQKALKKERKEREEGEEE